MRKLSIVSGLIVVIIFSLSIISYAKQIKPTQCITCKKGVTVYGEHWINNQWSHQTREHAGKVKLCVRSAYVYDERIFVDFTKNDELVDYGVRQRDWVARCNE